MSGELVPSQTLPEAVPEKPLLTWSPSEKALIGKDLNDEERVLLVRMARHTGLDPLLGQLYGWVYNKNDRSKRRFITYTSIGGARLIADRKGVRDGMEEKLLVRLADDRKELIDHAFYDPKEHVEIISATVIMWLKGSTKPISHTVRMSAYRKTGKGSEVWDQYSDNMLLKCAEMGCLRKVAPHDLAGIYIEEELQARQAEIIDVTPRPTERGSKRRNTKNAAPLPYEQFRDKFKAASDALGVDWENMLAHMKDQIGVEKNSDLTKPDMLKKAQDWLENDLETVAQIERDRAAAEDQK